MFLNTGRYITSLIVITGLLACAILRQPYVYGQNRTGASLRGTVYNSDSKKPVASGSVAIMELKKIVPISAGGTYQISLPRSD